MEEEKVSVCWKEAEQLWSRIAISCLQDRLSTGGGIRVLSHAQELETAGGMSGIAVGCGLDRAEPGPGGAARTAHFHDEHARAGL